MSDEIKHECGLAFIRLRKPFSYYQQKFGSVLYGLNKLYLLMEKQHNRGQDGAGIATVKLNVEPGYPFLHRLRSSANQPIADLFSQIGKEIEEIEKYQPEIKNHPGLMKGHIKFMGELLLGHLRYGTQGKNNAEFCHPFIKRHTIPARNLALAGNFNLVNTDELFALVNVNPGEFQKQSDLAAMKELMPGQVIIVNQNGEVEIAQILEPKERKACSFERIYFSRGSDEKIYNERKALGYHLSKKVLEAIDFDLKNTIFSFIPNTAEVAFYGLVKGCEDYLNQIKVERISSWSVVEPDKLQEMINRKVRIEKIAIKDVKMRTFISEDAGRSEMVQHVYDITYGTVRKGVDTLVVIDDSIVRGTTLKESIIRMLARLEPKKIIVVSSSPQIRYPDCYGIDMSRMGEFIAFNAAVELMKDQGKIDCLKELWERCKEMQRNHQLQTENIVKQVYKSFTTEEISAKIAELITPKDIQIPVEVIFQSIETLHQSCPNNLGDWYFTGNYPTPGGNKVVNRAFINYMEGKNVRSY